MKKTCLFLLTPMLLLLSSFAKAQPIQVKALRFERQDSSTMAAKVVLSGSTVRQMTGYGNWKISEARDNKNTDLHPINADDVRENAAIRPVQVVYQNASIGELATLFLAAPSSQATRVTWLRGTVSIFTGGTPVNISFPHIKKRSGQKLLSSALEAAGVQITVAPTASQSDTFFLQVRGNVAALQEGEGDHLLSGIGVTDSKGHDLMHSVSGMPVGQGREVGALIYIKRPLDDSMTLHLRLLVQMQTHVVPFELRNVPLLSAHQLALNDAFVEAAQEAPRHSAKASLQARAMRTLLAQGADLNARDTFRAPK